MSMEPYLARRRSAPWPCAAALVLAAGLLVAQAGCGDPPTEPSPLPRALGDIRGVIVTFDGLLPLAEGQIYALFISDVDETIPLGRFNVNAAGLPIDENGDLIERFVTDRKNLANSLAAIVSIERPETSTDAPSGNVILQAPFENGVSRLRVPAPSGIGEATGTYRVFTPTDGPNTNEASGIWGIDAEGDPSLDLPEATGGYIYEQFIWINGVRLLMGRFNGADEADTINAYDADLVEPPEVPGDDFLSNAPEGLTFPTNLSGARLILTLEPRLSDFVDPSQLIVLEVILPAGLAGGETVTPVNRVSEFPTGTAVLF